jgi:hypothetical protein
MGLGMRSRMQFGSANVRRASVWFAGVAALGASAFVPASAAQAAAPQTPQAPKVQYLRAGPQGAKARNLQDAGALAVGDLAAGTLLAVYDTQGDWLSVEVPGGFEVWIFGQYVKPASEAGMLEVTGSSVQQRPVASSGNESYPLQPSIPRGERVRMIEQKDPSKPLDQDWVKIWSPPGTRAWMQKSQTEALAAGTDGAAAWAQAVVEAKKRVAGSAAKPGAPTAPTSIKEAASEAAGPKLTAPELLKKADQMLARERAQKRPDYMVVRDAYNRVLEESKDGPSADLARTHLKEVDAYLEAERIRMELEEERGRRESELVKRQDALSKAGQAKDLYAGRFEGRGWLERRVVVGQPPSYVLRWSGDQVAEVVCNTGRYDLSVFAGYEIGVNGRELRAAIAGTSVQPGQPKLLDASRIEVLSGRYQGR